jgi:hypothetical protein
MVGIDDLKKIVALTLCSGYIKGDKPLSLLIISDRPESGKTEAVKGFLGTPYVAFASDISSYGLKRDFAEKIEKGEIRHIVIPELLQPLSRGKTAAETFTTTLQVLMEDGCMGLHTGFIKSKPTSSTDIKTVGFIACMPRPAYKTGLKRAWTNSGFLSRWLVVTYKYNSDTVSAVLDSIRNGEYIKNPDELIRLDGVMLGIDIPAEVSNKAVDLALSITEIAREQGQLYGFREAKHILSLIAANVIYERIVNKSERTAATMEDFEEINRLGYLFNEQFNEVKQ